MSRNRVAITVLSLSLGVASCAGSGPTCQTSTPPTELWEDFCPSGQTSMLGACFVDHAPTDGF